MIKKRYKKTCTSKYYIETRGQSGPEFANLKVADHDQYLLYLIFKVVTFTSSLTM